MKNLCCLAHNPWPDGECDRCSALLALFNKLAGPPEDLFAPPREFTQRCGMWIQKDFLEADSDGRNGIG